MKSGDAVRGLLRQQYLPGAQVFKQRGDFCEFDLGDAKLAGSDVDVRKSSAFAVHMYRGEVTVLMRAQQ